MANFKFLQTQAYERLKAMIFGKELSYDTIYSETRLAQDFGISRTPMRDALQRLSQEGYIDVVPSKGFCLHRITPKEVVDIFTIRAAIDGYCAQQIAQNISSDRARATVAQLEKSVEHMERIEQTTRSISDFVEEDFTFHQQLVGYVGNDTFAELFSVYRYRSMELARDSRKEKGRMEGALKEHRDILEAIRSGDLVSTYQMVMTHMTVPADINLLRLYSAEFSPD